MKKESIFYILIVFLMFFILGCGNRGKPESSYIGCYPKGTVPSSSAKPAPAHSFNANTFGGYYPGGQGNMDTNCYAVRYEPSCVSAYNKCRADYNSCNSACSSCNSGCNLCKSICTPWPACRDKCPCSCPCNCVSCTFSCTQYTPGPSTPASVGPSAEISGFGWVWGDLAYCSSDPYARATIYDGDADQRACDCISESYWDASGSSGKTCCGDDYLAPNNPPAENPDDPDVSENFCKSCKLGSNIGSRIWESSVNKCCGDDNFGNGNDNTDEPDWSEKSCTDCLVGSNQGARIWIGAAEAGCCGDDNEDCAAQASGKICSMDLEFKSPAVYSSKDAKGDIKYVPCKDQEFLADGDSWIKCDGTFTKTTVNEHDYLCAKKGKESIYECCGDSLSSCNSDNKDGVRLTTGQSVKLTIQPAQPVESPEPEQEPKPPEDYGIFVTNCVNDPGFVTNCENLKIGWSSSGSPGYGVDYHEVYISHDGGSTFSYLLSTIPVIVQTTVGFGMTKCFKVRAHGDGPFVGFGPFSEIACGSTPAAPQTTEPPQPEPPPSEEESTLKSSSPQLPTVLVERLKQGDMVTGAVVKNSLQQITGRAVQEPLEPADIKTFYCASDKTFTTDLDTKDKGTCEKAGFKWTGTKCCSEDDDNLTAITLREFYNDIGGIGGCWNSTFVESISFVKGINDSAINYGGEFHGCAVDKQNYNTKNDVFLSILDKHAGDQLIRNHDYCFNTSENKYYCSYTEKWLLTDGADRTHLSFAPIEKPNQTAECCAQKECWNGESCIQNQREKPLELPIGLEQFEDGLRCIDGTWAISTLKFTPDRSLSGYCPNETQCLLNPFGKIESEQCINSTRFAEDDYCDSGQWTTRTKLLALELSGFISGDYALFCDSKENTLNNLQYLTLANELAIDSLAKFKPNNFCVLKSGGKVITAVSINKSIDGVPANSLQVFGVTSCKDGLIDDGSYHSCDSTNKVWHNKRLKSLIFSNAAIAVTTDQSKKEAFEESLKASIDNVIRSIKRLAVSPPFDESYLSISKRLGRFYVSEEIGRTVIGALEGTQLKNEIVGYTNFDSNICDYVIQFNQAKKDSFSGVVCANELKNYYVLAQGSQFTNLNPESIWPDLTSKLRTK